MMLCVRTPPPTTSHNQVTTFSIFSFRLWISIFFFGFFSVSSWAICSRTRERTVWGRSSAKKKWFLNKKHIWKLNAISRVWWKRMKTSHFVPCIPSRARLRLLRSNVQRKSAASINISYVTQLVIDDVVQFESKNRTYFHAAALGPLVSMLHVAYGNQHSFIYFCVHNSHR